MSRDDTQYFYDVLVVDIAINQYQQKQHNYIPRGSLGIWYLDDLSQKSTAIYVHLDQDEDTEEEEDYDILLFPDSIISISPLEGVKFYGRMLTD